VAYYFGVLAH